MLLDSSSETLVKDYRTLLGELERYGEGLSEKPRIVALNKIDLFPDEAAPGIAFGGEDVHRISGMTGAGLDGLTHALVAILAELED